MKKKRTEIEGTKHFVETLRWREQKSLGERKFEGKFGTKLCVFGNE